MKQTIFIMNASLVRCENSVLNISDDLHEQLQKQNSKNIHYYVFDYNVFEAVETKHFNEKVNKCHTTKQLMYSR